MAAAAGYLDDDEFDDYNPHPYTGGYDISATYGSPLPPSPATCYPVSTPAVVAAPTAPQPSPLPQPPAPAPLLPLPSPPAQPRSSSPPQSPPPVAEPYYWPEPYNYGDAPRDQPMYANPEVFRGWPYFSGAQCHSTCGRDYWRQCMRGLDYLFGHSDGYGERRIGVDCHGVPVYANRKEGVEDAVVFQVAPSATGTVKWHDAVEEPCQSSRLSWYSNAEEETYAYEQPTYTSYDRPYEQLTSPSYDRPYEQPTFTSYDQAYVHPTYTSYDRPYEQPSCVPDAPTLFANQNYQEVYKEENSQYQEFLSYDAEDKISSQPIVCYHQHFGEQPLHIHVEPPETVSSHKLEYYENFSTYANQNDVDNLESSWHSYETQPHVHIPYDEHEPYRPSWSRNSGYYQACIEGVSPEYDNHAQASGECWDMSSLFLSPFYPQEPQAYEQSYGDDIV